MVKSLNEYRNEIKENTCKWCGYPELKNLHLETYDHDGGWNVTGFDKKQWLYVICPKCKYEWALWKLGVSRPWE